MDPCLIVKLLEYLYEQVIRCVSEKARNRVGPQFQKIHYYEPDTASDCHFSEQVFGFFGIGVHC